MVLKLLEGTQSIGVILADTDRSAKSVVEVFRGTNINILVQEVIKEAGSTDIQAFVVGGKVIAAMKRTGAKEDFRSNLHHGGQCQCGKALTRGTLTAVRSAKPIGLNPSIAFLDSIGVTFGENRLTLYNMIKGTVLLIFFVWLAMQISKLACVLREKHRRTRIPFGVAYGTDKELVKKAALEAASSLHHELKGRHARPPEVWLVGFGESSLDFELVLWLHPDAVKRPLAILAKYNWAIETALGKYNIESTGFTYHIRSGLPSAAATDQPGSGLQL